MRLKRSPPKEFIRPTDDQLTAPASFVVVVDQQEKHPYTFQGIRQDKVDGGRLLDVRREWRHLRSGDYSIVGFEDRVAIERKTLADLYGTLAQHRARFKREHERLAAFDFSAVVIEASWSDILAGYKRSRLNPKTVWRTALSWPIRYGVHWFTFESRRLAEIGTFRLLEKWWRIEQEDKN